MLAVVESRSDRPAGLFISYPEGRRESPQIERKRVIGQRAAASGGIFVKIGKHEFAQRALDRIAPAQPHMVAFRDRAPAAAAAEKRHHMVVVAPRTQVEQQRRIAVYP